MFDREWQNKLGINNNQYHDALFALTHKSILNEKRELLEKDDLDFYREIGKYVYEILVRSYIYNNISNNPKYISDGYTYSKLIFLNEFFNKFNLEEKVLYNTKNLDELTDKIKNTLSLQLIGYLYIYTSYKNLRKIFDTIFNTEKFVFINNELSLLNQYASKNKLIIEFTEISVLGSAHNPEFKYQLNCDGNSIIASGNSKKTAKNNCAKNYLHKYLSKEQYFELTRIPAPQSLRNRKQFIFSKNLKSQIELISKTLNIDPKLLIPSLTHSSASNEFNLIDNKAMKCIGPKINFLNILMILFHNQELLNDTPFLKVARFLENEKSIKENFLNSYPIKNTIIASNSILELIKYEKCIVSAVEKENLETVYSDIFNSLIFAKFFSYNQYRFIEKFEPGYISLLQKANYATIDPKSAIQEINQSLNTKLIDGGVDNNSPTNYTAEYFFLVQDIKLSFRKTKISIVEAEKSAARDLMIYFNHNIYNFLMGDFKDIDNNQESILYRFLQTVSNPDKLFINKNYFGLNYLKKEDLELKEVEKFINKITNIFHFSITHHNNQTQSLLIQTIINATKKIKITLHDSNRTILTEVLIKDVWNYCNNYNTTHRYNLVEHWNSLYNKSLPILKKLIKEDGLFIKNINNPCEELQLLAIENNFSALSLIDNPCKELFHYISFNYNLYCDFISNNSSDTTEVFIDVIIDDLNELINMNDVRSFRYTILKKINFEIYIKAIFKMFKINRFSIHTGYAFSSGLDLISNELNSLLNSSGELNLLIGSLKNYYSEELIEDMDKKTAICLNGLIKKGANVKTNEKNFYHGKIYCLECSDYKFIIMGSTNLSKNAFHKNDELDCLYIINNLDTHPLYSRLEDNWNSGTLIPIIDYNRFINSGDISNSNIDNSDLTTISRQQVEQKIKNIPDEILRKRLLLWLEYNPSNIYEEILIANVNYIAIEYKTRNMIVFESFIPGNSYFVFYEDKIEDILSLIENRTKKEVFELSNMKKRGYHVRNKLKLELNIRSYFIY